MKKVVVGFIINKNKLLLIKHKKKKMWLPVGGHVENGESLINALEREIYEEVRFKVEINKNLLYIMKERNENIYHYVCKYLNGSIKINKKEIDEYKWYTKKAIEKAELDERVKKLALMAFRYRV